LKVEQHISEKIHTLSALKYWVKMWYRSALCGSSLFDSTLWGKRDWFKVVDHKC